MMPSASTPRIRPLSATFAMKAVLSAGNSAADSAATATTNSSIRQRYRCGRVMPTTTREKGSRAAHDQIDAVGRTAFVAARAERAHVDAGRTHALLDEVGTDRESPAQGQPARLACRLRRAAGEGEEL